MEKTILVVDDEEDIRQSLEGILRDEGFNVTLATNGSEVLDRIEAVMPDLVLLDIWMEGSEQGLDVLAHLQREHPYLPVVMISGHGNIETAVKATKMGAYDYIEKPLSYDKILLVIEHCLNYHRLAEENVLLKNQAAKRFKLTGRSSAMQNLKKQIEIVAPTNAWVLITGKNGTGKELVAHTIHRLSKRADKPMVEVNCAAIPDELIESELFGHEKGAFTGAGQARRGRFDLANHGTLFLDEIGDMSLKTQSKILRILQEQKLERVGGTKTIQVDVRVIAATNKDLEEEIAQGSFREDLYYRLNVIPIHVPPLKERKEDIPILIQDFLEEFSRKNNVVSKTISQKALEALTAHDWPGNVRELKNYVERLVIMSPGAVIELVDLMPSAALPSSRPASFPDILAVPTLREAKALAEREYIQSRLTKYKGNVTQTAEAIGLDRTSLHKKIKALGLKIEAG
ncbi:MAG: sigma-54-dependent Fis family transcriptional regulator [Deltaproteobacteria bacterium]|nr:sigma-54-dependent Fis family transcriptional regulator [Deltaproteobacteria bacterium]MBW2084538.1 sigma-54-dependent Fis family transcriptional regulator [Deltaproteobacteria bacterium]